MIIIFNSSVNHTVINSNGLILKHQSRSLNDSIIGLACWEVWQNTDNCERNCARKILVKASGEAVSLPCQGKYNNFMVHHVTLPSGSVTLLYSIAECISERNNLIQSSLKYRRYLDLMDTSIVQFEIGSGMILYFNKAFEELSSEKYDDILYTSIYRFGKDIPGTIDSIISSGYDHVETGIFGKTCRWKIKPVTYLSDNIPLLVQLELVRIGSSKDIIRRLLTGELYALLSEQEYQIIVAIAQNKNRREIQKSLGIIPQQYDGALSRIRDKLKSNGWTEILEQFF